jgi:hypothetical protein
MELIRCLSKCYFLDSNTFVFIEDPGNEINSVVFNHNCYS